MKRMLFLALIAIAAAAGFTQQAAAQSYTVQGVTGRVQMEAGNNRIDIAAGDVLTPETVIYTGIGATLVLRDGTRTINVPAAQNGKKLSDIISSGSGIRISGNVARIDTGSSGRTIGQVSTASARAGDAAADDDIAAE